MNLNSLRPGYLVPRVRQILFQRRHPGSPWIGESAIIFLDAWLKPTDVGLEYGSGRSTAWFASRVGRMTSVENDAAYHASVKETLAAKGLAAKVDYRMVPCEFDDMDEPPTHAYAQVAREFADGSLDFAMVDGMIRETCMREVMPKIKPGGLLILDNANRYFPNPSLGGYSTSHEPRSEPYSPKWARLAQELEGWRHGLLTDRLWDTRVWVRPCA
jgi:predicted O-methyltransferase YrrM